MPKREIGLMGYVGEAVVEQWLRHKYPTSEYKVVAQIIPSEVPKVGGGYLDFGVIRKNVVEAVYEVKSQDYIWGRDSTVNKALLHIWNKKGQLLDFETQEGDKYAGCLNTGAFLVLLVGPNEEGMQKIGEKNLRHIILFQDVWNNLENEFCLENLIANFREDVVKVISTLKQPNCGKHITKSFLELRANCNVAQ